MNVEESKRYTRPKCPHCYSKAPTVACARCGREMCDACISDHPDIGRVCGLCYDHLVEPEEHDG